MTDVVEMSMDSHRRDRIARAWLRYVDGLTLSESDDDLVEDFFGWSDLPEAWSVYLAALEAVDGRAERDALCWQTIQYYWIYAARDWPERGTEIVDAVVDAARTHRDFAEFLVEWASLAFNDTLPWLGAVVAHALGARLGLDWSAHLAVRERELADALSVPLPAQDPGRFGNVYSVRNVVASTSPLGALRVSIDAGPEDPTAAYWRAWSETLWRAQRSSPPARHPALSEALQAALERPLGDGIPATSDTIEDPVAETLISGRIADEVRDPRVVQRALTLADQRIAPTEAPAWAAIRAILVSSL